jgi:hypothetical protein
MNSINLKTLAGIAAISGAVGVTVLGLGAGVANADDGWGPWVPWHPGEIVENWVPWYPGQIVQNWIPRPWHEGDWDEWEGDD